MYLPQAELQAKLEEAGLQKTGTKLVLAQRLLSAFRQPSAPSPGAPQMGMHASGGGNTMPVNPLRMDWLPRAWHAEQRPFAQLLQLGADYRLQHC